MKGKVYLVGAGPGDEKLITIKGLEKIAEADFIVYDELANSRLLKYANKDCEAIYVGKKAGSHILHQNKINQLLIDLALKGKIVTRLKGGDPYVFGRGGEEGQALYEGGIPFEIIPGITSAIGGLAYAGIPITHRECASSFHVITGHLKSEELELEFENLAKIKGTLVFLMGVKNLKSICEKLILNGKNPNTPSAIIYRASTPYQRVVISRLDGLAIVAKEAEIEAPSLIVIGEVVKFREQLNFYEKKPLFGKRIVVTRSRAQASLLQEKIEELGGLPIPYPVLKCEPINQQGLQKAISELFLYNHVIFTSTNGVEIFFKELHSQGRDARAFGMIKVTAIGSATEEFLLKYGIKADYVPEKYIGEEIVAMLKNKLKAGDRILIPRSKNARDYLVTELSKNYLVDEVITYQTVMEEEYDRETDEMIRKGAVDYITFTSSSTVDYFIRMLGSEYKTILKGIQLISIGPITSKQIRSYGITVDREALKYTIDGVIQELINFNKEGKEKQDE